MPWSGGTFTRVHNWTNDANANIGIESDRHDEEDDNLADGINQSLARDGGNSPTANVAWGGYKITGLGDATAATDAMNRRTSDARYLMPMQCRVTLSTGVPIMTSTVSGATTVYVTPYGGTNILLYNGSGFSNTTFSELSQATSDGTKSPSAVTTNSNYDIFVWDDSGTIRATRGPAWSSDTSRGTGAGTSELELVNGVYVNKVAIANGPAARYGTYVGTVRSDGSSQINWTYGGTSDGGTAGVLGVWNMFNRVDVITQVRDTTNSWTTTTLGSANASTTNRVSYVCGLAQDAFEATYQVACSIASSGDYGLCAIGYDVTGSSFNGVSGLNRADNSTDTVSIQAQFGTTSLGFHFMQAMDYSVLANTVTYLGDNNTGARYMALTFKGRF